MRRGNPLAFFLRFGFVRYWIATSQKALLAMTGGAWITEWMRIILLVGLVLYVYSPFISGMNMGAADAQWYQYILHDALLQAQHGMFPTYVGQSEFYFIGGSDMRAPYYLLFGQFINLITFGQLSALTVQHLTVILSALIGALIFYFALRQIAPQLRWTALLAAFFYISCPGVIGLIYGCDMYHSFMAVPYVPLVIYGLIRSNQKNDLLAYVITAMGISLIWMAHPPIGVWMTGICAVFFVLQLALLRKGLVGLLITIGLFSLLNLWQFVSVDQLGLRDYLVEMPDYVTYVIHILRADIPGVFMPLQWATGLSTPFLQLGYALWASLIFAFIVAVIRIRSFLIFNLLLCTLIIILFLYPLPWLGRIMWSIIPTEAHNLNLWPMQRLYVILAALVSFSFVLALSKSIMSKSIKKGVGLVLLVFLLWNLYQAQFFMKMGQERKGTDSWNQAQNIYLINNSLQPTHQNLITTGPFEPVLKNKLTDKNGKTIKGYDNEAFVVSKRLNKLRYDVNQLPIRIESFTPYKAVVNAPSDGTYLEILKEYFPGYQATVNSDTVTVLKTQESFIKIPLKKGLNQIELNYVGTPVMHAAFYISAGAWIILLIYWISMLRHCEERSDEAIQTTAWIASSLRSSQRRGSQ